MNRPTPPCENCRMPHNYRQFIKLEHRDEIDIRWFCGIQCKEAFVCDDSTSREYASTGGWV